MTDSRVSAAAQTLRALVVVLFVWSGWSIWYMLSHPFSFETITSSPAHIAAAVGLLWILVLAKLGPGKLVQYVVTPAIIDDELRARRETIAREEKSDKVVKTVAMLALISLVAYMAWNMGFLRG